MIFDFIRNKLNKEENITEFKYYLEPFSVDNSPLLPPFINFNFFGETKESKIRMKEWIFRLDEYHKNKKVRDKL